MLAEFLRQLRAAEKAGGIMPDPDVDAFLKASAVEGTRESPVADYITRILGLEARQFSFRLMNDRDRKDAVMLQALKYQLVGQGLGDLLLLCSNRDGLGTSSVSKSTC